MFGVTNHLERPLCVGLNAHLLSLTQTYRGAGINGYIYQLLRHLPTAPTQGSAAQTARAGPAAFRYIAYLHEPAFEAPAGMQVERSRWNTRSPWRRIVWEQTRLAARARQLDLLHGLAFVAPVAARCPTVITVHDLSFLRFPDAFRPFNRAYLSLFTKLSTRRAARVIAVSESTRQDVIAFCGVPAERVVVVPNGVDAVFCPAEPAEIARFRAQKGLPERFILFLGTLEPRKNLVRLLEAYAQWRRTADQTVKLVLAGGKGWYYDTIFARVAELGLVDDVFFPGYVPVEELPWWYRAAELFVYPSLFEGFGLPVLEAMACGTPVITARASSLPEVAGDAAVLVDPKRSDELAAAMNDLLNDRIQRAALRAAGLARAAHFSWAHTATATAEVYRDVLAVSGRGGRG